MRNPTLLSGALLALVLVSPLATAQVYKWTDANGQVHYGDTAPSNATQIKAPTPPALQSAPQSAPPATRPGAPPAGAPTGASRDQAKQVERDVATARAQQCKEARENYDKSVRAQRIFKTNAKGEREYLSDKDADTTRLQLKTNVDTACGA